MRDRSSGQAFDVVVAGAGPVGLTLAIDLGRRGVKCLILEQNATPGPWPKMDRTNARSMEFYRRIGIVERVRALGYPPDNPMDVFLLTRMNEPALAVLRFGSVAERRREIAASTDGSVPLEPYQLVSQNKVEPLLKEIAEATPNVTVRYGEGVTGFEQDTQGVTTRVRGLGASELSYRSAYLVGCDGGSSSVRKSMGVKLEGEGRIRERRQVIFFSEDLYERIPVGKGRHYNFIDGTAIVAQGDRKEFTFHTPLPADTDFVPILRHLIGFDCQLEIRHVTTWWHNLLSAERYQAGRVFLAGDSAHLVIPSGGLGLNTGLGDAFDLSWKLAGTLQGWGGPGLLPSYDTERRPVGAFNVAASGWATERAGLWRRMATPECFEQSERGAALRARLVESFILNHGYVHAMRGAEFGYTYAGSPLIADEPGNPRTWDRLYYYPHARPGVRLPHMWLKDARAVQDILGEGYTLLDLRGDCDSRALEAAFREIGAPFEVIRRDEPHARIAYGRSVFLLRPDLHIAWSGGSQLPEAVSLARRVTGHR